MCDSHGLPDRCVADAVALYLITFRHLATTLSFGLTLSAPFEGNDARQKR